MVGPIGRSSSDSFTTTQTDAATATPSGTQIPAPTRPRYAVVRAKTPAASPPLHKKVLQAHDTESLAMQVLKMQEQTPPGMLRRIVNLATELADLRDKLREIPPTPSQAPTTLVGIKQQAEANKRKTALANKINLKTFLLEGTAAAAEIARGAEPTSLTYAHMVSSVAIAVEEMRKAEGAGSSGNARNGYARLFEDHPSFRDNGSLGQFELAASTHNAITASIKQLQQEQRNGADNQSDIDHLKLSDQLVKNTVTALFEAHGDIDKARAKELVNAIHTEDVISALKRKHAAKNFRAYASAVSLPLGASVVGAFLHYGTCRTGTEELIKRYKNNFNPNSYQDLALMALPSGLVLALTYFLFNRTVVPLTKAALETIPGLNPRPLQVTSAAEVIPTIAGTAIKDGTPVDLSSAEFQQQLQAVEQKRKDFKNIERRCREGGLVGDILGYCSFGGCQFSRAMLDKAGFGPRVTGTLIGTALEATLDTIFRMRQTFDDGEGGIPTNTLGAPKGMEHVKKGLNDLKIWSSPDALRIFSRHLVGGIQSTELSNFVLLAISRHGDSRLLLALAAFFAAVFVVAPMYAATEFEPAEEFEGDRYAGTKTAVLATIAPNDPRVPHATRNPDTPEGSLFLRTIDKAHKITQGVQAVIPNFMADTLTAGVEQVRDLMNAPTGLVVSQLEFSDRSAV
jgi:hypothetical protein